MVAGVSLPRPCQCRRFYHRRTPANIEHPQAPSTHAVSGLLPIRSLSSGFIPMSAGLNEFQQRLGHSFADENLLRQALTHASFGHEKRQRLPDNQRLEFLGDAVLQLAATPELFARFPELPEGERTVLR